MAEGKVLLTAIRPVLLYDRMLGYKEISCAEDECSRDVHASLDV